MDGIEMWGLFDIDQYVPKMYCLQSLKQMLLIICRLLFKKYQYVIIVN